MSLSKETPARSYAKGIGDAVADRTINRKITRQVETYIKTIDLPRRDDMALDHEVDEWCKSNNLVIESYHVSYGDDLIVRFTQTPMVAPLNSKRCTTTCAKHPF
jgi:hypothetical protein